MFGFRKKEKPRPLLVTPDISQLTPLSEYKTPASLYGLGYSGGFQIFSQTAGIDPFFNQSYTPEPLGLLQGQYVGQPLVFGGE